MCVFFNFLLLSTREVDKYSTARIGRIFESRPIRVHVYSVVGIISYTILCLSFQFQEFYVVFCVDSVHVVTNFSPRMVASPIFHPFLLECVFYHAHRGQVFLFE